jgi:DNA repair exonuclease SbcCD nuclease subunit
MDSSILDDTSSVINSVREIEKLAKKSESRMLKKQENVITLRLSEEDVIYERLSNYSDKKIKTEILQYIEDQARYVPLYNPLVIRIERHENTPQTASNIEEAIKENLKNRVIEKQIEMTMKKREFAVFMVLGVAVFVVKALLGNIISNASINEILVIIAWVFIWRSVETLYFERRKL